MVLITISERMTDDPHMSKRRRLVVLEEEDLEGVWDPATQDATWVLVTHVACPQRGWLRSRAQWLRDGFSLVGLTTQPTLELSVFPEWIDVWVQLLDHQFQWVPHLPIWPQTLIRRYVGLPFCPPPGFDAHHPDYERVFQLINGKPSLFGIHHQPGSTGGSALHVLK